MKSQKLLIIDCFALAYRCAIAVGTDLQAMVKSTEPEEIEYKLRLKVMELIKIYDPTNVIFASDSSPYWRHSALSEFYLQNGLISECGNYVQYNNNIYPVTDYKSALKVGEIKALGEIIWKNITQEQISYFPKYKGTRPATITGGLTKEEFYALVDTVYSSLTEDLNCVFLKKKGMEADDIAAFFATTKRPETECVLATVDHDWFQLTKYPNVIGYNLLKSNQINPDHFSELDLTIKIVGGDRGDNLSGIPKYNAKGVLVKGCYSTSGDNPSAKTLVEEIGVEATYERFKNCPYFKRNVNLITLPSPAPSHEFDLDFKTTVKANWKTLVQIADTPKELQHQFKVDINSCETLLEELPCKITALRMCL